MTPKERHEIFLELHIGEKSHRYVRVPSYKKTFTIGTSKNADLRIHSKNAIGCHVVIYRSDKGWTVADLSGADSLKYNSKTGVEFQLKQTGPLEIAGHKMTVHVGEDPFATRAKLNPFAIDDGPEIEPKLKSDKNLVQQIIVRSRGRIVDTQVLSATDKFLYWSDESYRELPAASSTTWKRIEIGNRTIDSRLIDEQELLKTEKIKIDEDIYKATGIAAAVLFLLLLFVIGISKLMPQSEQQLDKKSLDIIYNAKAIQKKRSDAQKTAKAVEKAKKQDQKDAPEDKKEVAQAPAAEAAVAPKSAINPKATQAITSLRSSGLKSLIGKIAKRASRQGQFIQSIGATPDTLNTGRAVMSVGTSIGGGGGKALVEGNTLKIGGISTQGKAGGVASAGKGSRLVAGKVGTGATVSYDDDETIIDGGLDKEIISEIIRNNIGKIRYCYERQLSSNPDLYGKIVVKFSINAAGTVMNENTAASTMKNDLIEGCVLRQLATIKFPAPKGGTEVRITFPFLFKSVQ